MIWFVLTNVASWSNPFLVKSAICRVERILDGGHVRRVAMWWVKKSYVVMAGIGTECGMETRVSVTISVLVEGMKHAMHL